LRDFVKLKREELKMDEKRRWGRVKVPENKINCRIAEPADIGEPSDIPLMDISAGGISFYCKQALKKGAVINFLVKFPSTFYLEEGKVWGEVAHCRKIDDKGKYLVGISFIRKKKG
jgi:c-di-GMP-binding flagellar brake protein YcgR